MRGNLTNALSAGKDARQLVLLKGDLENPGDKLGCLVKEDFAKKYITYFQNILHHNNGYFSAVNIKNGLQQKYSNIL